MYCGKIKDFSIIPRLKQGMLPLAFFYATFFFDLEVFMSIDICSAFSELFPEVSYRDFYRDITANIISKWLDRKK